MFIFHRSQKQCGDDQPVGPLLLDFLVDLRFLRRVRSDASYLILLWGFFSLKTITKWLPMTVVIRFNFISI